MITFASQTDPNITTARQAPASKITTLHMAKDILVVDDDKLIAQCISDALEDEGYEVRVFHDGASALLDIVRLPPGLMLLDVTMPILIGDDLLRYLRQHGFVELPIIMMTAGSNPENFLADGATDILPKPFEICDLLDKVARYLPDAPP